MTIINLAGRGFLSSCLIYSCLFSSCIRYSDVALEDYYELKPVIYSIISPGDSVKVLIIRTLPFGSTNVDAVYVKDAVVQISTDVDTIDLPFHPELNVYAASQIQFPILPGGTYKLWISMKGGNQSRSETTIPLHKPKWKQINYKRITQFNNGNEIPPLIEFTFSWNYDDEDNSSWYVYSKDIIRGRLYGYNYLQPDPEISGMIMQATYVDLYSKFEKVKNAQVTLVKANSEMQEYLEYLNQLQKINDQLDMGLFWELYRGAIKEYTNIEGGYGFFGGYLKNDTTVNISFF